MPAAPILTGTPGDRRAILSWSNVGALTYKVQRLTGNSWDVISSQTGLNFTQTGLTNGTAYRYRVRAIYEHGPDKFSNEVTVKPYISVIPLQAPVLLGNAGNAQNVLDWNDVSRATSYNVRRSINSGTMNFLVSSTTSGYTDTNVVNGTMYDYVVKAKAADGELSDDSNQITLIPQAPGLPPLDTPVLSGTAGNAQNVLDWDPVATADYYRLKRADGAAGDMNVLASISGSTAYTDTGLNNDALYRYNVRAFRLNGDQSANSNEISLTPVAPLPDTIAPVLTAVPGDGSMALDWNAPNAVVEYRVQQGPGWATIAVLPSTTSNLNVTGLQNGIAYTFRVKASYSYGIDRISNEATATPFALIPPLTASTITGTASPGRTSLSWSAVSGAEGYELQKSIDGGAFVLLTSQTALTYTDNAVTNGTAYDYRVRPVRGSENGPWSNEVNLVPRAAASAQLGWAGLYNNGAGVTGGTGATAANTYTVTNFADLKAALLATGKRIINVTGNAVIDGDGANVSVTSGNMTLDGIGHTKSIKGLNLVIRASNVIIRNIRLRPGDDAAFPDAAAGIMLNPGLGKTMSGVLIEHCSVQWAEDVCINIFNGATDVTIQYNIIGPSLYETPYKAGFNGYALSMHGDAAPNRHKRVSIIRNLILHSYQRNLRCYAVEGAEYVNNVDYNWGNKLSNANPVWANFVSNMAKKGPGSPISNQFYESQIFGDDNSYFPDSVYFDDNKMWSSADAPLTPVNTFAAGVRWTAGPLNGPGVTGALHGVTATAASLSLAAEVVAAAGTPSPDALETEWKDDFTNGTWNGSKPNDWYRGPGVSNPQVIPTW